ncbi:MAG: lytic transglycosylase domain-containing protein [Solirubrobacterales bacterium]|nr:lytic transglycosylase domain-containing protein [Solirubrobacterales bacterium]MBV9943056.1 lytic transglycosylase domain-containing protein [Solirubrobacterales bacterium]
MSPSAIDVAARSRAPRGGAGGGAGRRRAAARRRRRRLLLLGFGTLAVALGVILTMPLLRKAVNDLSLPLSYAGVIRQQAADKHLDPALVAAVIYAETKFEPRDSAAGAVGPMQIMPQTASFLARRSGATTFTTSDLNTPAVNIAYGSYYLRYLLDEYGGNVTLALAAYNGGESNVDRWLGEARADGRRFTVSDIPFPETRAYVLRVLHAQQEYRRKYASQLYG